MIKKINLSKLRNIVGYHLPTLIKIELKKSNPKLFQKLSVKPLVASLNITGKCTFRCRMCGIWHHNGADELTTAEWKDVIRQLRQEGILHLNITGGEPLLRDDLVELLDFASSLGYSISIATNGYLLSEDLAVKLKEAGVNCFCVSVDALGEDFDMVRGAEGAYEKVHSACRMLSGIAKVFDIKVVIYFTLMKYTLPHAIDVVRFAEKLNFPVYFNLLDYTPYFFQEAKDNNLWIEQSQQDLLDALVKKLIMIKRKKPWLIGQSFTSLDYIRRYFKDPLQKHIPCSKAFTRVFVDHKGKVFGGCWSMGYFGDIRKSRLNSIMNSREYLTLHRKMFLKDCPGCSCGYHTDLKYSFAHLLKEMEFRFLNKTSHNTR